MMQLQNTCLVTWSNMIGWLTCRVETVGRYYGLTIELQAMPPLITSIFQYS